MKLVWRRGCWALCAVIVVNHQRQRTWPCLCQEINSSPSHSKTAFRFAQINLILIVSIMTQMYFFTGYGAKRNSKVKDCLGHSGPKGWVPSPRQYLRSFDKEFHQPLSKFSFKISTKPIVIQIIKAEPLWHDNHHLCSYNMSVLCLYSTNYPMSVFENSSPNCWR